MENIAFSPKHLETFRKLGVDIVYLFGSHARGNVTPMSDVDIGIVFHDPEQYRDHTLKAYNELYHVFTDLFPAVKQIDIVFLQLTPMALQFASVRDGKILFERDRKDELQYRERVFKAHADFQYFYSILQNAVLQRI